MIEHKKLKVIQTRLNEKTDSTCNRLLQIWTDMGFDEKGIDYRADYLQDYVYGLMDEIVTGELDIKAELEQKMIEYRDKVQELQKRLNVEIEAPRKPLKNPLKEHDYYKNLYAKLLQIKEENYKLLRKLKKEEGQLCKDLNENEIDLPCDRSIVGDDELDVIEEHINELCQEKQTRWNMVKTLSENVNILQEVNQIKIDEWSSLSKIKAIGNKEITDDTELEGINIDKKSLNKYRKSLEKLYNKREELVMKTDELAVKINKMWTQFNLKDESLVDLVLAEKQNSDYTVFNYQTLQNEYQRCVALKRMFHRDYIEELRDQIKLLWAEYLYELPDRVEFEKLLEDPVITDELYDKHKKYLDKLTAYGQNHQNLITDLTTWINTWENFVNFDIDYSDPNRFKSKNYSALYEQNERLNYKKKLPRLEAMLEKHQKQYKAIEKQEFIIEGQTIMKYIKNKKVFHDEYKNTLRKERQNKLNAPSTPSRTPKVNKMDKLNHVRTSMLSSRSNSPASSISSQSCSIKQERTESPKPIWSGRTQHCCPVKHEQLESPSRFKRTSSAKETNLARMVNSTPKLTKSTPAIKQEPEEQADMNTPRMLNFPDSVSQTSINSVSSEEKSKSQKRVSNKNLVASVSKLRSKNKRRSRSRIINPQAIPGIIVTQFEDDMNSPCSRDFYDSWIPGSQRSSGTSGIESLL